MQFPIWDIVWMAPTSCWIQCRKQHWKSGLGFQGLWVRNIEHQDNSEIKEFYALLWAKILRSRQNQRKLSEWHILNCFKLAEQKALESDNKFNFESSRISHKVDSKRTAWSFLYLLNFAYLEIWPSKLFFVHPLEKWKLKLLVGKFAWGVNAKHCWMLSTNFWKQKVLWHHPAMFYLTTSSTLSRQ